MNFKDRLLNNWRAKLLGAAVVAFLGAAFWSLPFTQGLDHFSYDLPFAFRNDIRPGEALVVYMDDESRIRLKQSIQGPWDRALHVRLLDELFEQGAKAVVFDVLFDEPGPDKAIDEEFSKDIKGHHGQVVLGASIHYAGGGGQPVIGTFLCAVEPLGSAAPWGVAELPLDNDGTVREQYYNEQYTNFAWQTATVTGFATTDRKRPRWINYYGPSGTIPHTSYDQILEHGVASEAISNKVVFVGMAPIITYKGSKGSDEYPTPYTRWTAVDSPGVEIQATAFLNLARRDWLTRLSLPVELSLIATVALALGFLLPVFRPGMAFAFGAGVSLVVTAAAIVLALQFHKWFCWAVIPAVEVPAGLVWLSIRILSQPGNVRVKSTALAVWAGADKFGFARLGLVFSDIVGSTELNARYGNAEWAKIRSSHFTQARSLVKRHDGWYVKDVGDEIIAVFKDDLQALHYAMDLEMNTGHETIQIRAGVNFGRVEIAGLDIFGNEVNITSRIISEAIDGQIWMAETVRNDWVDHYGIDSLAFSKHPGVSIKGVDAPVTLWSVQKSPILEGEQPPEKTKAQIKKVSLEDDSNARSSTHEVFISYSLQDKPVADIVCAELEGRKIPCWIAPRNAQLGKNWAESLIEGIETSRIMVLIFSARTNSSVAVIREVERAVNRRLIIIPLRLENVPFSKPLEFCLSTCQWLDAFDPPLEPHIERLSSTVAQLLREMDKADDEQISP